METVKKTHFTHFKQYRQQLFRFICTKKVNYDSKCIEGKNKRQFVC